MCVCVRVCVYLVFVDRTVFENIIMTISSFTYVYDLSSYTSPAVEPWSPSRVSPGSRIQHTSPPSLSGGSLQEGKNASLCVCVFI